MSNPEPESVSQDVSLATPETAPSSYAVSSSLPTKVNFGLGKMRLMLLGLLLVGFIAGIAGISLAYGKALRPKAANLSGVNGNYTVASIPLGDLAKAGNLTIDATGSLSINGQLRVNGGLVLDPATQPAAAVSSAGQIYYDRTDNLLRYFNGQVYVDVLGGPDKTTLNGLSGNITVGSGLTLNGNQLFSDPTASVSSLQGQTGAVTLTSGGGISIAGTTITNAGVTMLGGQTGNVGVGAGLSAAGGTLMNTGVLSLVSGSGPLVVTHDASGNYTIMDIEAGIGGNVALGPVASQDDSGTNPSIWINKTGTGNLLQLSTGAVPVNRFVIDPNGAIISGTIGFNQVTSKPNFINSIDTATGDMLLGAGLARSGQTILNSGVLSVAGLSGDITLGSGLGVSAGQLVATGSGVGSVTGTPNQIFVAGSGALTLSLPQDIATTSTPTFAGLNLTAPLSVANGGTGLPVVPGNGQILIGNGAGYAASTLTAGPGVQIANAAGTITISAPSAGSCASCANDALSNLAGVALNTSLLPGVAGAINLGSGLLPFGQLSLSGSSATPATNNFLITGTSTGGTRTITLPNASGTVAVSASGYLSLNAATGALSFVGPLAVADGGTGASTAAGARTNLGSAASGANSDITSLSGLSTALTVAQGGSGVASLNQNGVLLGNGTNPISALLAGGAGQCLVSTAGAPVFQVCPGSGGVASVNGGTGAIILDGIAAGSVSTVGNAITINDATTAVKGLASFDGTNFTVAGGAVNTIQGISSSATPTFAGLNLTAALSVGNGGTGATTAAGARTNLGAAASGANSDITSLAGLTTALSVGQGGIGATSLTSNGVLLGNGASPVSAVTGLAGQCLVATAGAPSFQACPGSGGVANVNGVTGAVIVQGTAGSSVTTVGQNITINDATSAIKGLASFNAANLTVTGGDVNTIQNISVTSSPTFAGLSLGTALSVGNGGTGSTTALGARTNLGAAASGANSDILSLSGLTTALSVSQGGTGAIIASGARTNLGAAASGANTDITSLANTTSVGTAGQPLSLQGSYTTTLTATSAGMTTTLGFATPGANVTYLFQSATAGTYSVCTTFGNCSGVGGGVTTTGGTAGAIPKFSAAQSLVDSLLSESGATITVNGILSVNTLTPTAALTLGATSQNLTLQGATTTLSATSAGVTNTLAFTTPSGVAKTISLPNASGTIAVSAAGPLSLDAAGNLTCATCLTSGGGGGSAGVSSLDGMTGALLMQGTANQIIVTDNIGGSAVVLSLPQSIATSSTPTFAGLTSTGGLSVTGAATAASFNGLTLTANATGFSVSGGIAVKTLTLTGDATIDQSLATISTPTFGGLTLTSALAVTSGGTGATTAAGARTNLGAAGSGANSDITSLTGLTTALSVPQGGTGINALPTTGQLLIGNGAGYTLNTLTAGSGIQVTNAAGSITISAPGSGTCSTCANSALSNLASVALNTSLLPGAAGVIDLGSGLLPFGQLSLSGSSAAPATNNFLITGTSTGGTRTITLPDASGTVAVSASGYLSLNAATGALSFVGPLAVADGGTGTTTAPGARTNLGAAASGANSDITSITGLTTALSVAQGGTGAVSLNQNGVIIGNGTSALSALVAGAAGQCLVSTAGSPVFQACPGSGGVSSVNGGTGAVTIAGITGSSISTAGNAITINDATAAIKGLASFDGTNFSVAGGAVNTIQGISSSATPTFAGLNLTAALSVGNGGTGSTTAAGARTNLGAAASGANSDITSLTGLTTALAVGEGGTGLSALPTNGQLLIGNATGYTLGNIIAGTGISITNAAGSITAAVDATVCRNTNNCGYSVGGSSVDLQASTPGAAQVGNINVTGAIIAGGVLSAGSVSAGTVNNLTLTSNATGFSITGGATPNTLTLTGDSTINQSLATTSSPTFNALILSTALPVTSGGTGAITMAGARTNLGAAAAGANSDITSLTGLTTALTVAQGGTGTASLTQNGVLIGQGTSGLTSLVAGAAGQCLVSTAGAPVFQVCPGTGGVTSVNAGTGAIILAGTAVGSISTVGNNITINDATSAIKGLASFSSTNFSVTAGAVDTVQGISPTSSPTFNALALTNALTVANGGTGLISVPTNGQILIGNGTNFSLNTLTAGAGMNISNTAGTITLSSPNSGTCLNCADMSLNNLAGVAINTSLLPGVTNTIDLGSGTFAFRNAYLTGVDTASAVPLNVGTSNATAINLNQNTVVAAGKSLTVTGGITASRPAAPTEGMLYYDTTTHGLIVYTNGKWSSYAGNTATKIVGTSAVGGVSGAIASQNTDGLDYVNTSSTSAQTVINAAIASLPAAGGSIYLMEGTYIVDATINVPANVTLTGAGAATILKLKSATNTTMNIITATGTKVIIQNLEIDGNKATQSGAGIKMYGVYFSGVTYGKIANISSSNIYWNSGSISAGLYFNGGSNNLITNNVINSNTNAGIDFNISSNNTVTGNTIQSNGIYGIVHASSSGNTISGNTIQSNGTYGIYAVSAGGHNITGNNITGNPNGIYFNCCSVNDNIISGNTISATNVGIYAGFSNNNTITGNSVTGSSYGIQLDTNSGGNTIIGNNVQNSGFFGIWLKQSSNNTITGNNVFNSGSYGIYITINSVGSNNNLVADNRIKDSGGANENYGIVNVQSNNNIITGNEITDSSCTVTCNAIWINSGVTNYLSNNYLSGTGANPSIITDSGTGTIYANQPDGSGNLINKSQGGGFTVGAAAAAASLTLQGGLKATALPAPTLDPTVTNVGTTGAITYRYQLTALDGLGESLGSTIQQTTTGNSTLSAVDFNTITWTAVGGAYQYRVYRCTGAACTPALIATAAGNTTSYSDKAVGAPTTAVPTVNTTGGASLAALLQGTTASFTAASSLSVGTASSATGSIGFKSSGGTGTITLQVANASANNYTITLPNESGTICTNAVGGACSGSYIQNQNAGQQAASNLWISGSARTDTSILTPLVDTASAVALNVGSTNATAINLNQNTTLASGKSLTVQGSATFQNATNSLTAFSVKDSSGGAALAVDTTNRFVGIGNASPSATLDVVASTPAYFNNFESGLLSPFTTSGGATAQWSVTTSASPVPYSGSYVAQVYAPNSTNSLANLILTKTLTGAGNVSFWYQCTSYWSGFTFQIDSGTKNGMAGCGGWGTSGWLYASYGVAAGTHTFTWSFDGIQTGGNPRLSIDNVNITNVGSGTAAIFNGGGVGIGLGAGISPAHTLDVLGDAQFKSATNSTTAFQVQNSAGAGMLSVDTTNSRVGVGITIPLNALSASPLDYQTGTVTRTNTSATLVGTGTTWTAAMVGDIIVFADGTTNSVSAFTDATHIIMGAAFAGTTDASPVAYRFHRVGLQVASSGNVGIGTTNPTKTLDILGDAKATAAVNSTTTFQIQDSTGTALLVADTTNMKVTVQNLVVTADLTVNGHIVSGGSAPTIAAGTAACTTPTVSIAGTDTAGIITVTTGTGCAATGKLAAITFATAFGAAPKVTLTPALAASATLQSYIDSATIATTAFDLNTGTAPADATTYKWFYQVIQ